MPRTFVCTFAVFAALAMPLRAEAPASRQDVQKSQTDQPSGNTGAPATGSPQQAGKTLPPQVHKDSKVHHTPQVVKKITHSHKKYDPEHAHYEHEVQ